MMKQALRRDDMRRGARVSPSLHFHWSSYILPCQAPCAADAIFRHFAAAFFFFRSSFSSFISFCDAYFSLMPLMPAASSFSLPFLLRWLRHDIGADSLLPDAGDADAGFWCHSPAICRYADADDADYWWFFHYFRLSLLLPLLAIAARQLSQLPFIITYIIIYRSEYQQYRRQSSSSIFRHWEGIVTTVILLLGHVITTRHSIIIGNCINTSIVNNHIVKVCNKQCFTPLVAS